MAVICPQCKGDMVQALLGDNWQCHGCGAHFNSRGERVTTSNDNPDEGTGRPNGPPPAEDKTGVYDHTGPHPTPMYPTPPHPDRPDGLQKDIDKGDAPGLPQDEEPTGDPEIDNARGKADDKGKTNKKG